MTSKTFTCIAVSGIALVFAASYLMDGPSEQDLAEAVALDLKDAQAQAAREAGRGRTTQQIAQAACDRLHGMHAMVLQLQDGTGFVCRRRA